MASNSKLFKNLLTTASAIAMIAGGINSASAASALDINGNTALTTGVNLKAHGGAAIAAAPVPSGSVLFYLANGQGVTLNAPISVAFNTNGFIGGVSPLSANTTITGVLGGGPNSLFVGATAAGLTLTLNGAGVNNVGGVTIPANTYTGLANVDANNQANFVVNASSNAANDAVDLSATTFTSTGGVAGTLNLTTGAKSFNLKTFTNWSALSVGNGVIAYLGGGNQGIATTTLGDGATLSTLNAVALVNLTGSIINGGAKNQGIIDISTQNLKITGNLGAAPVVNGNNNALAAVNFNTAKTLFVYGDGAIFNVMSIGGTNVGSGTIDFYGNNIKIYNSIGSANQSLLDVSFVGDATGGAAGTLSLPQGVNIYALGFDIGAAAYDNTLILNGNNISNDLDAVAANSGILNVLGSSTIGGNIGPSNLLTSINFTQLGSADTPITLTVGGTAVRSKVINFNAANTGLILKNAAGVTVTASIATNAANQGFVNYTGTGALTFNGAVGQAGGNSLAAINALTATGVILKNDSYVKTINIADNAILSLNTAGGKNFLFALPKGTLQVATANKLLKGTVLGTAQNSGAVFFSADVALEVDDTVNLGTVTNNALTTGRLTFDGSSIVSGTVGTSQQPLNKITVNNQAIANSVVEFQKDVFLTNNLEITGKSHVKFGSNLTVNTILPTADQGEIEFNNQNDITVNLGAPMGADSYRTIFSGGNVKFTGGLYLTDRIEFTNATKPAIIIGEAADIGTLLEVTSAGNRIHTLASSGTNLKFAGNPFGSEGHVVNLRLDTDHTVNITDGSKFFGSLSTNKTDNSIGTVTLNADNINVYGINNFSIVTVNGNSIVTGNLKAKTVNVASGKTLTLNAGQDNLAIVTALNLLDANSGFIVSDGISVTGSVVAKVAGKGHVTFNGGGSVSGTLGTAASPLYAVNFNGPAGKTLNVDADITATKINVGAGKVSLINVHTWQGTTTFAGSNLDLGKDKLLINGNATATGNFQISTTFSNNASCGTLVVQGAGNSFDLSNVTAPMKVNVTLGNQVDVTTLAGSYNLISTLAGATIKGNPAGNLFFVNSDNYLLDGSISYGNNTFVLQTKYDLTKLNTMFDSANPGLQRFAGDFANARPGSEAAQIATILGSKLVSLEDKDDMRKTFDAVPIIHNSVTQVQKANHGQHTSIITGRMGQASGSATQGVNAAAAGEYISLIDGVYVLPFYNHAEQDARNNKEVGYHGDTYGATVGFDTKPTDTFTFGIAGTYAKSEIKFKNGKPGDKTDLDSWMFSVYAMQEFAENAFVQGIGSFGSSSVKTKARRHLNTDQNSLDRYETMSYNAELLTGYDINMTEGAFFTPMVGVRYGRFNDAGYKQKGLSFANLDVNSKTTDKIEGIVGMKVSIDKFTLSDIEAMPELHGFVNYDFANKKPKVETRIDGLDKSLTFDLNKAERVNFSLGGSLNARSAMLEYGIGYDALLAKKYVAHQGTLKLKVNL